HVDVGAAHPCDDNGSQILVGSADGKVASPVVPVQFCSEGFFSGLPLPLIGELHRRKESRQSEGEDHARDCSGCSTGFRTGITVGQLPVSSLGRTPVAISISPSAMLLTIQSKLL